MTNKEWLDYLAQNAPDELAAWFDAEHVETANTALDGDTAALNAKIAELTAELDVAYDNNISLRGHIAKMQDKGRELQKQEDNLAADLLKANNEREQYRKLFGMALDWAHEITMLESSVDEGMA